MIVPAKQDQGSEDQASHSRQQDHQPTGKLHTRYWFERLNYNDGSIEGKITFLPSELLRFYRRVCKQARPTKEGNAPRRLGVASVLLHTDLISGTKKPSCRAPPLKQLLRKISRIAEANYYAWIKYSSMSCVTGVSINYFRRYLKQAPR